MGSSLVVVTATTDPRRAAACLHSWGDVPIYVVVNGYNGDLVNTAETLQIDAPQPRIRWIGHPAYLGSVAAFAQGVAQALADGADIVACLHDDLEIHDRDWAEKTRRFFQRTPACGLLGFGGAIGLGAENIYQVPYEPMQLARVGFRSNLTNAEDHGIRVLVPERVACLDGFSQIGRADFWIGLDRISRQCAPKGPLDTLHDLGMVHHAYDSALGVMAAMEHWETWYLPIRCTHYGGRTAVGDPGYQIWAQQQNEGRGDHGFWETAHAALYEIGRGILPIRV